MQSLRSAEPVRVARSKAPSIGATRAKAPEHDQAPQKPDDAVAIAAAGLKGTVIDGPRHTYRAIRKNPIKFAAGVVAMGAIGAIGVLFNFPGEWVAVGLSALAVGAQVRAAYPTLKHERGAALARRIGSDVVWPTVLFLGTWWLGHSITGDHLAHGPPTTGQLITSFASSAVIGGDAPAVGVTALDTARGGDGAPH